MANNIITLTQTAKDYLASVSDGGYVTLGVKSGGCSGFQYIWDFSKNWPDVKWSDPIDYVSELGGNFLKIINPTANSSCGCGESFNV